MPTKIEWCDETWNIITGCSPISPACDHCYARRMAYRLRGRYGYPKDEPFKVTFHPERLNDPTTWRKPRRIFVCSMGDLFHEDVNKNWRDAVFCAASNAPQHTYMFLTKRPDIMRDYISDFRERYYFDDAIWPANWCFGVTAENQDQADKRIPILLSIPAAVHFVSIEPMLGPVDIYKPWMTGFPTDIQILNSEPQDNLGPYPKLDWIICGGETGPLARPMYPAWAKSVRDQCEAEGVPFFFKGKGTEFVKKSDYDYMRLDGKEWKQFPKEAQP